MLAALKMKPLLTRNNSFCLSSRQDTQAFNLGYVYSYDCLLFSSFFIQKSNRCFVSRLQDSRAGKLRDRKYNEVSQEVGIDNNKANLELLIQAFFLHESHFFQLILSVQLIDIHTRSILNVTILLLAFRIALKQ